MWSRSPCTATRQHCFERRQLFTDGGFILGEAVGRACQFEPGVKIGFGFSRIIAWKAAMISRACTRSGTQSSMTATVTVSEFRQRIPANGHKACDGAGEGVRGRFRPAIWVAFGSALAAASA